MAGMAILHKGRTRNSHVCSFTRTVSKFCDHRSHQATSRFELSAASAKISQQLFPPIVYKRQACEVKPDGASFFQFFAGPKALLQFVNPRPGQLSFES